MAQAVLRIDGELPDMWQLTVNELERLNPPAETVLVAVKSGTTRRGVLDAARMTTFTPDWWDDRLVTHIAFVGKAWVICR